jgi:acyl phosphate:glycerol-3-phosphate acyltransferase
MEWIAVLIGAYLLGAVPVGYMISRARGIDITGVGSGNIGATNVMRALGPKVAVPVFLLDIAKGLVPALVANHLVLRPDWISTQKEFAFLAGTLAVLGHCLSPFLRFRGGKGVATGLGVLFGASPLVAATVFGVFLVLLALTRYVSLASLVAAIVMPACGLALGEPLTLVYAYAVFGAFIIIRHRTNIKRLREGTENRFSWGKSKDASASAPTEGSSTQRLEEDPQSLGTHSDSDSPDEENEEDPQPPKIMRSKVD